MNINYLEFNNNINEVFKEFNAKKLGLDPLELMKKIKWNF